MSLDLGHSKSYVQSISSGRALPSLQEFIAICDYFKITPLQFFDAENDEPILMNELIEKASLLNPKDLELLISIADRFYQTSDRK